MAQEERGAKKQQKPFDGSASAASTCPTGSNRSAEPVADEAEASNSSLSSSCLSFASRRLRRRRLRSNPRVPLISVTSLYNRLQTSGVVLVDCRKGVDFSAGHLPDALHCPHVHTLALSCSGQAAKTVDDVLELSDNPQLRDKLERRDLIEVVVIGGNHTGASFLYRMDWGYRFAKMLMEEGRVFSVRFLAQGFPAFAKKYSFMLVSPKSPSQDEPNYQKEPQQEAPAEPAVASPTSAVHFPNEIVDGFLYLGVAIKDKVDVDIAQEFGPTIEFIQKAAEESGRVLIHCVQGVSRSSTICIWYVMLRTKCTLSAAYSHVLKCRPLIFPNRGFMAQLIANERELYGDQSVTEDELELLQNGLLPPVDRSGSALNETFLP
jgi:rhodanese-related sulfurtransferase